MEHVERLYAQEWVVRMRARGRVVLLNLPVPTCSIAVCIAVEERR